MTTSVPHPYSSQVFCPVKQEYESWLQLERLLDSKVDLVDALLERNEVSTLSSCLYLSSLSSLLFLPLSTTASLMLRTKGSIPLSHIVLTSIPCPALPRRRNSFGVCISLALVCSPHVLPLSPLPPRARLRDPKSAIRLAGMQSCVLTEHKILRDKAEQIKADQLFSSCLSLFKSANAFYSLFHHSIEIASLIQYSSNLSQPTGTVQCMWRTRTG